MNASDYDISTDAITQILRTYGGNIVPYNPVVEKVYGMTKDDVSRLDYDAVTDYIVFIGQNLIYLDNQYSIHRFRYEYLKAKYEEELARKTRLIKRGTVAEKTAEVLDDEENAEIKKLKDMVDLAQMTKNLLENKTDMAKQFLDALKRKQNKLQLEYQNQYRTLENE